jgi:hypothetical protein
MPEDIVRGSILWQGLIYTETKKFSNKWKTLDFIAKSGVGCKATVIKDRYKQTFIQNHENNN